MEIPDRLERQLGDEEVESAVSLGGEDVVCFTPSRTLLYRGEGLLSDDSVETFDHDLERLGVSEGRRKSSFTLTYVDSEQKFTVGRDRTEPVLERLLAGVLGAAGVIDDDESVEGVFRFSELTLVITDKRVVKHVGSYLWDADYEEFPYSDVTGLEFEEGSVATSVVLSVEGRPQRIKAPRGDAELVRRTLTTALFECYDVDSLDQLNQTLEDGVPEETASAGADIGLDDSIAPLVTSEGDDSVETLDDGDGAARDSPTGSGVQETAVDSTTQGQADVEETKPTAGTTTPAPGDTTETREPVIDPEDIETMKSRLATLTTVARRQNKLLKQQQETIDQLIEELRRQH